MKDNKLAEFPVTIFSNLEQYSPVLSKARCRIFYKYENRNGSYITDEFAEKLISTLPYTPLKGIYDDSYEDYEDHGNSNDEGRIYGIVPQDFNFAWELHLDDDGIEREYACADVLIFTALYEEAKKIVGKSQSMELFKESIKGEYTTINGKELFKYDDGCFIGLQVLGENVEPCFEGSAFFSLYKDLTNIVKEIEEYALKQGGKSEMNKLNFKLSDNSELHSILWEKVNSNYTEEAGWEIGYGIFCITEKDFLRYDYENGTFARIEYQKDENDEISLGEVEQCFMIKVNEQENESLKIAFEKNQGTYEKIEDLFVERDTLSGKIEELEIQVATLTKERDENATNYTQAQDTITSLTEEVEQLQQYKAAKIKLEKQEVLDSYTEILGQEIVDSYTKRIDEFTNSIDLDKELAYELKKNNMSIFSKKQPQPFMIDTDYTCGIEGLLNKYKNKVEE